MQPQLLDDEVTFDAAASAGPGGRVLVVACGAIAREVLAVIELNGWTHVTLQCLPGQLHNTPREIAGKVDAKLTAAEASGLYDAMFVAYGDCGTAGALDDVVPRTVSIGSPATTATGSSPGSTRSPRCTRTTRSRST